METEPLPTAPPSPPSSSVEPLSMCCVQTMRKHAQNNPMMVCDGCKQIIKCFLGEKEFRNYVRFCQSRRRKVVASKVDNYYVVVFQSHIV